MHIDRLFKVFYAEHPEEARLFEEELGRLMRSQTNYQIYRQAFSEHSFNNPMYEQLVFYTIAGQLVRDVPLYIKRQRVDMRVSIGVFQTSGSGKSAAVDFIVRIMHALGMTIHSLDDFSDAALVGSYTKEKTGETRMMYGVLSEQRNYNFIFCDEVSMLLKPNQHNAKAVLLLQKSQNTIGSKSNEIGKDVVKGLPFTIRPKCSLMVLSFIPPELQAALLKQGLFQRMLISVWDVPIGVFKANKDIILDGMSGITHEKEEDKVEEIDDRIIDMFKSMAEFIHNNDIQFDTKAKEHAKMFFGEKFDEVSGEARTKKEILCSQLSRAQLQWARLCLIEAGHNKNATVTKEISVHVCSFLGNMFDNFRVYIDEWVKDTTLEEARVNDKIRREILTCVARKPMQKRHLVTRMIKVFKVSKVTALKYLQDNDDILIEYPNNNDNRVLMMKLRKNEVV